MADRAAGISLQSYRIPGAVPALVVWGDIQRVFKYSIGWGISIAYSVWRRVARSSLVSVCALGRIPSGTPILRVELGAAALG